MPRLLPTIHPLQQCVDFFKVMSGHATIDNDSHDVMDNDSQSCHDAMDDDIHAMMQWTMIVMSCCDGRWYSCHDAMYDDSHDGR